MWVYYTTVPSSSTQTCNSCESLVVLLCLVGAATFWLAFTSILAREKKKKAS